MGKTFKDMNKKNLKKNAYKHASREKPSFNLDSVRDLAYSGYKSPLN